MNYYVIGKILAILIILLLTSCTVTNINNALNSDSLGLVSPDPITKIDSKPVQRIVALTSLSADIIERLDNTKLVGMSGSRLLDREERFEKIPRVSEGRLQNLTLLSSLAV